MKRLLSVSKSRNVYLFGLHVSSKTIWRHLMVSTALRKVVMSFYLFIFLHGVHFKHGVGQWGAMLHLVAVGAEGCFLVSLPHSLFCFWLLFGVVYWITKETAASVASGRTIHSHGSLMLLASLATHCYEVASHSSVLTPQVFYGVEVRSTNKLFHPLRSPILGVVSDIICSVKVRIVILEDCVWSQTGDMGLPLAHRCWQSAAIQAPDCQQCCNVMK